ncbi:hypothetical protein ACOMHN_004928 [Nucella lapillus]
MPPLLGLLQLVVVGVVLLALLGGGAGGTDVHLGMMSPFKHVRLGWETNAAAATMAIERAETEGLLDNITVFIHWEDDGCKSLGGAGKTVFLRDKFSVDAYIGPPCSSSTSPAALLASYWNLPMFTPASSDPSLADKHTFTTLVRLGPPFNTMGAALVYIFRYFRWRRVVLVSRRRTDNRNVFCDYSTRAAEETFRSHNITVAESIIIGDDPSDKEIDEFLSRLRQRGRIIILCTEMAKARRNILLRAHVAGMFDGSYVIFIPDHLPPANVQTPWVSGDVTDDVIKAAHRHVFQITVAEMAGQEVTQFRSEVPVKMAQPPWNYNATLLSGRQGSEYSPFLHDVVYLYLLVLNETLSQGLNHRDGQLLFRKATSRTFRGVTGNVKLDGNGDRLPDYWLWRMSRDQDVFSVAIEARMTSEVEQKVFVLRPITWLTEDGNVPLDTPVCGFFDELCPADSTVTKIVASAVTVVILIVIVLLVIAFIYRRRVQLERELELMLWKVDYSDIQFTKNSYMGSISQMSLVSLASATSSVPSSRAGGSRHSSLAVGEAQMFSAVGLFRGGVVAIKKISASKLSIGRSEQLHLKAMKELIHENLLTFVGLCLDERFPCILNAYCSKGSLQDIIENDDIKLDWTFKISMVTDLVNGMQYLHANPVRYHGRLKSSNCLVDNRWTLKVAGFGLDLLWPQDVHGDSEGADLQKSQGLLWTAPEVLCRRNGLSGLTVADRQRCDVYSFAIVLFEIVCRCYPYDTDLMTPTEIIGRIKRGEDPPFRPSVPEDQCIEDKGGGPEVPEAVVKLMHTCWSECPADRPLFAAVKSTLTSLSKGKKCGIVDNMLLMLEKYANNLEDIVEHRTSQLMEERKKSDMLLYRMLPRVVAEKLKGGQQVSPELYEAVTIYFSDIVGFTSLASASSPIEIVDLLNDLYTIFDSIIATHDVYKVETIGDAYMVVSGVPERNENRHVSEIANMALDLLTSLVTFRVRHSPSTQLHLRIGVHTGPCAAGVVGLTMPRYCLFGDTVNTASRMESTGLPLKIQVSEQSKELLERTGGYDMTFRGTIEVKGKGPQKTYWLEGKEGFDHTLPLHRPPPDNLHTSTGDTQRGVESE